MFIFTASSASSDFVKGNMAKFQGKVVDPSSFSQVPRKAQL